MNKSAFSFFQMPERPPKPRKVALCVASDHGLPLGFIEDFLESHHDIVDYVKLADHAGMAARYSADLWHKKLAIYHKYGIKAEIGGVTFELAFFQNKASEFFSTAKELGVDAIEISDDVMPKKLDRETRNVLIHQAMSIGLEVVTEVGAKSPALDKPFDTKEAWETLQSDLKVGASRITVENSDTVILREKNPQTLVDLASDVGLDKLVFEVGPGGGGLRDLGVWLMRTVSRDISVQNIELGQDCILLDGYRRGFGREVDDDFFRDKAK